MFYGVFWLFLELVRSVNNELLLYIKIIIIIVLKILVFFEEPLYLKTWMYDVIYTAVQKFGIFKKLMTCYIHKKWL